MIDDKELDLGLQKERVFSPDSTGIIKVEVPNVNLNSHGEPLEFQMTLVKVATRIEQGTILDNMEVDSDSEKLQRMHTEARALRDLPEAERPTKLLNILYGNMNYAYDDVIEELQKTNPDLASWVAQNTGLGSSSSNKIKLSELVDSGYGVCRHLSVVLLDLANEAGLEGSYQTYSPGIFVRLKDNLQVRNVIREDNAKPLFKLAEVGDEIPAHAWVELKVNGKWIPYDPSTRLYGDTPEGMATFRKANYRALVGGSLEMDGFPPKVGHLGISDLAMPVGQETHTGKIQINCRAQQKPIRITLDGVVNDDTDKDQWPKHTSYKGDLKFNVYSVQASSAMNVSPQKMELSP